MDLELESHDLPLATDHPAYMRECYHRLIGVTCAAVPSVYAAHEISRDRAPDLGKFYEFIGAETDEAKKLKKQIDPLTLWTTAKGEQFAFLRRRSGISDVSPYPNELHNTIDDTTMVLVTDENGAPKRFKSSVPGKDTIVYIDMHETTNRQYVSFLNRSGGVKNEGGADWLKHDSDFFDITGMGSGPFAPKEENYNDLPVFNVNWFGARAYCRWAKKSLPTLEEWRLAASPKGDGDFPWGKDANDLGKRCSSQPSQSDDHKYNVRGGTFKEDRSRIGCYDMAGNLAEWCEGWADESNGERVICGGSWFDKEPNLFKINAPRAMPQVSHQQWLGFRGVVRISIDKKAQ